MSYYLRVLGTDERAISLEQLEAVLEDATLEVEEGDEEGWQSLLLCDGEGEELAVIERNLVEPHSLAEEELAEFDEELVTLEPASGAEWVRKFLAGVRVIYAIEVLGDDWDAIGAVKNVLWRNAGEAIFQADDEGFSNTDGYQAVWQFPDDADGTWWMGVMRHERWVHFETDLADATQRAAFLRGELPEGVRLAD